MKVFCDINNYWISRSQLRVESNIARGRDFMHRRPFSSSIITNQSPVYHLFYSWLKSFSFFRSTCFLFRICNWTRVLAVYILKYYVKPIIYTLHFANAISHNRRIKDKNSRFRRRFCSVSECDSVSIWRSHTFTVFHRLRSCKVTIRIDIAALIGMSCRFSVPHRSANVTHLVMLISSQSINYRPQPHCWRYRHRIQAHFYKRSWVLTDDGCRI